MTTKNFTLEELLIGFDIKSDALEVRIQTLENAVPSSENTVASSGFVSDDYLPLNFIAEKIADIAEQGVCLYGKLADYRYIIQSW